MRTVLPQSMLRRPRSVPVCLVLAMASGCVDPGKEGIPREEENLGSTGQAVTAVVENGGFETADVAGFRVRGAMMGTTLTPHSGAHTVRLRGAAGSLVQDVSSKLTPGVPYVFSAWVRQTGNTAGTTVSPRLLVSDDCDALGSDFADVAAPLPFASSWHKLSSPPITFTQEQLNGPVCFGVANALYTGDTFLDDLAVSDANGVLPDAVNNPGLESGTLAGWRVPAVRPVTGLDPVTGTPNEHGGEYAMELGGGSGAFIAQDLTSRLVPGVEYAFKVWVKVTLEGGAYSSASPRLRVGSTCDLGKEYGETPAQSSVAAGWQMLSLTRSFTEAELAGRVCAGVLNVGFSGLVLVDDLSVTTTTAGELCDTDWDDNGNGAVNDPVQDGCICEPGTTEECPYPGPAGTKDNGVCRAATRACNADGKSYGACAGERTPSTEVCNSPSEAPEDEDCDGQINEGACKVVAMDGAYLHTLALRSDGTVWAFGDNMYGQLGNGTKIASPLPTPVTGLSNVTRIAAGIYAHSHAVRADGTVWSWGYNEGCDLGLGQSYGSVVSPIQVPGLSGATLLAAGTRSAAVYVPDGGNGALFHWGFTPGCTPQAFSTPLPPGVQVVQVDVEMDQNGSSFSEWGALLDSKAHLWTWGGNASGQLGDGTTTYRATPAIVAGLPPIKAFAMGVLGMIALGVDGSVWQWGSTGLLAPNGMYVTPTPVSLPADIVAVAAGGFHWLALQSNGDLWSWGENMAGQLGRGWNGQFSGTQRIATPGLVQNLPCDVKAVGAGHRSSMAICADDGTATEGTAWA